MSEKIRKQGSRSVSAYCVAAYLGGVDYQIYENCKKAVRGCTKCDGPHAHINAWGQTMGAVPTLQTLQSRRLRYTR